VVDPASSDPLAGATVERRRSPRCCARAHAPDQEDPHAAWPRATGRRSAPATAADAQAIGAVFDAAVREGWTYLGELAEQPMFTPADWDRLVAAHAPPNVLLVATDHAGRILGYTAAHPEDCELFLLFVHPAFGRRGVGRTLLSAAHDALRAAGCREAFLFTHEQNERALAVYERAGYRPDGSTRESDMSGTAIRELRLVKQL
jgi:ribosomal protein S18 acetylase RimI-like enzyme